MNQTLSFTVVDSLSPCNNSCCLAWEYTWTLGHLRHDVALLIDHLRDQPGNRWALCFENSYLFYCSVVGHATLR